jgi:hypothetical protein
MDLQNNMKEAKRAENLHIGVCTGSSSSLGLFDTKSTHCRNYRHDRKRHSTGKIILTPGIRRRHNHNWFASGGT